MGQKIQKFKIIPNEYNILSLSLHYFILNGFDFCVLALLLLSLFSAFSSLFVYV
jgi:hypothetical protein